MARASSDAAAAWTENPDLPTRFEDMDAHVDVNQALFCRWVTAGRLERDSGGLGFASARAFASFFSSDDAADADQADVGKLWFRFLDVLAELRDNRVLRATTCVSTLNIGYVLLNRKEQAEDEGRVCEGAPHVFLS